MEGTIPRVHSNGKYGPLGDYDVSILSIYHSDRRLIMGEVCHGKVKGDYEKFLFLYLKIAVNLKLL